MTALPAEMLTLFPPSREELFDDIRCRVDAAQLREIADSDYGWGAHEVV